MRTRLVVLQQDIAACRICPSLKPWRQFPLDAYGTPRTGYLLVGEAPGYRSWKKTRRFTGPAGMLIRRALARIDHARYRTLEDLFYITDVVKCHPASSSNACANRSPRRREIQACVAYLARELNVLRPSVVLTFGKVAAGSVPLALALGRQSSSASGRWSGPEIIPFPHPSPRNQITIRAQYTSMQALEEAVTRTCRRLIARLEDRAAHA